MCLVNQIDQGANMVDGSLGQDAVSEVEDMAGAAGGLLEDSSGLAVDLIAWGQEYDRIEVPLNGDAVAESFPGLVELDPPVEPDDAAAGPPLMLKQRGGARAEMDDGNRGIQE